MSSNNVSMSSVKRMFLLLTVLAAPVSALAADTSGLLSAGNDDPAVHDSVPTTAIEGTVNAGQLARLDSKIAVLKLNLEIAKLNAGIASEKNKAKHPEASSSPVSYPGAMPNASMLPNMYPAQQHASAPHPRILSLSGAGEHYQAMLALPDGGVMNVVKGSAIGNGWRITDISAQGVMADHDGKVTPLHFSDASPDTASKPESSTLPTPIGQPMGNMMPPPPLSMPGEGK